MILFIFPIYFKKADEFYTTMHSMRSGPQSIIHAKPSEEKIQLVLQAERNGGVPIEDETEHDGWKITPTVVPVEVCMHKYINIIRLLCGRQNQQGGREANSQFYLITIKSNFKLIN